MSTTDLTVVIEDDTYAPLDRSKVVRFTEAQAEEADAGGEKQAIEDAEIIADANDLASLLEPPEEGGAVVMLRLDAEDLAAIAKVRAGEEYEGYKGDGQEAYEHLRAFVEQAVEEAED